MVLIWLFANSCVDTYPGYKPPNIPIDHFSLIELVFHNMAWVIDSLAVFAGLHGPDV